MKHLPSFCYSAKKREPDGLCLHYFSAIYADPPTWDDPLTCWELLFDLNLALDSRQYSWAVSLGKNRNYASYEWLVSPDGEIIELVPYGFKTYHAGKSSYRGRENCNNFLAGVGIIAAPNISDEYGFTEAQYKAVAEIAIDHAFIPRITTHEAVRREYKLRHPNEIVADKKDPGESWSWRRLNEYLNFDLDGG